MTTPESTPFDQFAIVGLGLIGGSIAKDIRVHYPNSLITAIDHDQEQLDRAMDEGVIDKATTYGEIGKTACFVIIATPIDKVISVAERVAEVSRTSESTPDAMTYVIDTASVKSFITEEFEALTDDRVEFLATHPMAGTEFSGFRHARKDLFHAKPWMVCPHKANTSNGLQTASDFIRTVGGKIREIDANAHDKHVAVVSHSIIALSNLIFDFVATKHPDSLEFAGDGFTSTTRLASGNPELHASIMANNPNHIANSLEEFQSYLIAALSKPDELGNDFFAKNMARRNRWIHRRK